MAAMPLIGDGDSIVIFGGIFVLMLLLIVVLILLYLYKPWRFLFSPRSSSRSRTIKSPLQIDDVERPLVSEDLIFSQSRSNDFAANYDHSTKGHLPSHKMHGAAYLQQIPSATPQLTHSDSFVLDIIDQFEDASLGQTLKRPLVPPHSYEEQKSPIKEDSSYSFRSYQDSGSITKFTTKENVGSNLTMEVIAGPSCGLRHSVQSKMTSRLPLTLGRVSPSDILLKDSEVSGKHALINWNSNKQKWEVVDMGSLNGTLLNSRSICHPDPESRHWGDPTELADGDVVTLGTSTQISVQVKSQIEFLIPFGVGIVSDPMALRRGGKKLPMEDVCYYRWPLPGADQFGVFGICDGHGGVAAATSASKALPETVSSILSDSFLRERVLSQCNATDVLRDVFAQTESCMNHYYEGCTATLLLIWADHDNFFAQCANVGDSACVMNVNGKQIKMSEDHRITSYSERLRMQEIGKPLKDGETRLCGLNLGRMLGDKFLKQQDIRFSSQPYISQVVPIQQTSGDFALLASDGFWDVVNLKKAFQLVQQGREKYAGDGENSAEKVANFLLSEARTQRTKDNTSVIFLDFDRINRNYSSRR